jgi:glycosyltransferase involved in cell wall biosynthesis
MKVCLIVYKIDPEKGSEDASGYHIAKELIKSYPDLTLISRYNNIKKLQQDNSFQSARLIGIDVPPWLSFYKKKSRGIILYYYLWQMIVAHTVKNLQKQNNFDVIHQLNFHADWAPHFFQPKTARLVWGPIAHHPLVPWSWLPEKYKIYYLKELLISIVKGLFWHANPSLHRAIKKTQCILFANKNIPQPYKQVQNNIVLQSYAGSHWPLQPARSHDKSFHLLFTGRLIPLKGPHLACDAYHYFLNHVVLNQKIKPHMTFIGSGLLDKDIRQHIELINRQYPGMATFHPWMEREKLINYYKTSDFMLYPSLEAQGLVVSEALSQNCAVITLHHTGPALITAHPALTITAEYSDYNQIVKTFGEKLIALYQLQQDAPESYQQLFNQTADRAKALQWPVIAKNIMKNYNA